MENTDDKSLCRNKKIRAHVNEAKRGMKALNLYKREFDPIIGVYAEMRVQYDEISAIFGDSEYKFEVVTSSGTKKAPIVTTLESLRKDILAYATQLGLTPQGLLKADAGAFANKKQNALTEALKAAGMGK